MALRAINAAAAVGTGDTERGHDLSKVTEEGSVRPGIRAQDILTSGPRLCSLLLPEALILE